MAEEQYQTWASHLKEFCETPEQSSIVFGRSTAGYIQDNGTTRGRPGYTREIYDNYRPAERIPTGNTQEALHEIMTACKLAYETNGLIKSSVDLMSEFCADGIEIVHEDESVNNFYKNWQRLVKLPDRAERFANWYFKAGNTVVRRRLGKLDTKTANRMKRAFAAENFGSIPTSYIFYDPATVYLVGDNIGSLSTKKIYTVKVPLFTFTRLKNSDKQLEREIYDQLPEEIKKIVGNPASGQTRNFIEVVIPTDKIFVAHYKKDDTDIWAKSFLYSVLSDIYYNDKLKLAKTTALDGIVNVIRLWKLGDHKTTPQILPDANLTTKLANILANNVGGGSMDIIWNSAIELQEFYPPIEKLVNFAENNNTILLGLGLPETLLGGSEGKGGSAFATIGLKNFTKRLEAGRRAIIEWLNAEIDIIQEAMGFRKRPEIRFTTNDFHDERTYYNLLIQLVDRNIISGDRILEIIDEFPHIEKKKVQTEEVDRKAGERPEKAGPYHNPQLKLQQKHEIAKINSNNLAKDRGNLARPAGRPDGSRDTVKRTRTAADILKAHQIYDFVDNLANKTYLEYVGIDDVRKLSASQKDDLETLKNNILPHISPYDDLSEERVLAAIQAYAGPINEFQKRFIELLNQTNGMKLTQYNKMLLKTEAYLQAWGIENE